MTPKLKAIKLVDMFEAHCDTTYQSTSREKAKQCALIAVDEIIKSLQEYDDRLGTYELQNMDGDFRYWDKVKQEIEKL